MWNAMQKFFSIFDGRLIQRSDSSCASGAADEPDVESGPPLHFSEYVFTFLFRLQARQPQNDQYCLKQHAVSLSFEGLISIFINSEITVEQCHNIVADYSHAVFKSESSKQILIKLREQGYDSLLAALCALQGRQGLDAITQYLQAFPDAGQVNIAFVINQSTDDVQSFATSSFFVLQTKVNDKVISELKAICFGRPR